MDRVAIAGYRSSSKPISEGLNPVGLFYLIYMEKLS